jgi:hypothetical protein
LGDAQLHINMVFVSILELTGINWLFSSWFYIQKVLV